MTDRPIPCTELLSIGVRTPRCNKTGQTLAAGTCAGCTLYAIGDRDQIRFAAWGHVTDTGPRHYPGPAADPDD